MPESSSGDAKTDREKFLQQIIRHIRALLISAPSGLNVVEIQNDYLKIIGKPLPYREAGFNSAIELLQALPDVVRPTWIRGELILRGIADETSKRVANLVARQKKVSKKRATHVVSKRPLMLPVVPYYVRTKIEELLTLYPSGMLGSMFCAAFERHFQVHLDIKKLGFSLLTDLLRTIPNTARIEAMKGGGYRVHGISSQKSSFSSKGESTPSSLMSSRPSVPTSSVARSSTSNTQSSTSGMDKQRKSKEISASKKLDNMKVFLDSRNSVSETLRREIAEILHERPNGVWCARLPVEYKKMYRKDLSVRDHGFTSVIELADAIPDVVRIDRPVKTGDWLLHSNSKKNPETPFSEPRQVDHDFKPEARAVPPSGPGRPPPKETLVAEDGVGAGTYYPKLTVRQAGYIDMYVTHPVDPHNFWVMLIENWPKLEALAEDIRVFYSSADGDRYTMPEWFVSVGQVCCALYDEDGAWYRALITSVNSIHNIEVLYVDYGNRSRVPLQNLRILRASFIKLPAQSVHAQLAYIKPTQGSEWTPGCCHRFYRITKDFKPLVGLLCGVKDETLSLCLCDTNHSDDIHINDMLVEEGYAVFSPSSSPPPSAIPEDTNSKDKHKAPEQLPVISHAPGLPPPRKEQQFFNSNIVPAMAQSQIPDFPMHFAVNYSSDILSYLNGNLPDTSGMPLVQVPGDQEPLCSDEATVSKQGDDMSEEEMAFMQEVCHELDESPTEESILKRIGLMGICTIHIINHEKKPYVTSADISALFWDSDLLRPMLRQKKMAIAKLVLSHDDHGALLDELVRCGVRGTMDGESPRSFVTLYKLESLPEILHAFSHSSPELLTRVLAEIAHFEKEGDAYWLIQEDDESGSTGTESESLEEGTTSETELALEELKLVVQAMQFRRKRILQSLMTADGTGTGNTVDELLEVENKIEVLRREVQRRESQDSNVIPNLVLPKERQPLPQASEQPKHVVEDKENTKPATDCQLQKSKAQGQQNTNPTNQLSNNKFAVMAATQGQLPGMLFPPRVVPPGQPFVGHTIPMAACNGVPLMLNPWPHTAMFYQHPLQGTRPQGYWSGKK